MKYTFFYLLLCFIISNTCQAQSSNLSNNATYGQRYQEQLENNTAKPNSPLYSGGNNNSNQTGQTTEILEKGYYNKVFNAQVKTRMDEYETYKRQKEIDDANVRNESRKLSIKLSEKEFIVQKSITNYIAKGLTAFEARELGEIEFILQKTNWYDDEIINIQKFKQQINTESYELLDDLLWKAKMFPESTSENILLLKKRFPNKLVEIEKQELILMSYYFGANAPNNDYNYDITYSKTVIEQMNNEEVKKVFNQFDYLSNKYPEEAMKMAGYCKEHLNPFYMKGKAKFSFMSQDNKVRFEAFKNVLFTPHTVRYFKDYTREDFKTFTDRWLRLAIEWIMDYNIGYLKKLTPTDWAKIQKAQNLDYDYISYAFRLGSFNVYDYTKTWENKYPALKDAMKGKGLDKGPESGYGTAFINIGVFYEGNFENGKPNGIGKCQNEDGTVYEGNFKNGNFEGKGKITWSDGETYIGDFKNNMADGIGIKTYSYRGQIYEGGFKENKRNGQGVIKWTLGASYSSMFKNDVEIGEGIMKNVNGSYEKCIYKNGKILSIKYFSKANEELNYDEYKKIEPMFYKEYGKESYTGEMKDGKANGKGRYQFENGSFYEGDYKDNKYEGKGTKKYADSSIYKGDWKNGLHDGVGSKKWKDGLSYNGEWKENKKNGKGVFTYADSSVYIGTWVNDDKEGNFVIKYKNGDTNTGMYISNKREGLWVYVPTDNNRLVINYTNDKKNGEGIYTKTNGYYSKITYVNNVASTKVKFYNKQGMEISKEEFNK